jgi:AcrR family transcriptional regulator
MAPEEREALIAKEAIHFFAEFGFDGQTRELAKRLQITQPLLYRYFPSKEALIDRVYEDVFLKRWNPEWDAWIKDRSLPLRDRLTRFYLDYARVILSHEWVRLFLFAGLKGVDINQRSISEVMERIYPMIIGELRDACGLPHLSELPMQWTETERVLALHSSIFYLGIRRWIYRTPYSGDENGAIEAIVAEFLDGSPSAFAIVKTAASMRK